MAERCAVIGVGQTMAKSKREDVSIAGLVREAALAALEDAGLGFADIDAVVIGKAPDMFEGVMMPELYLAPALGAVGKPMFRVHTAGSVGGSTAIVAAHLVASGVHERVLTVAFEKQCDSDAMWALSVPQPFSAPLLAGAGGYFAPIIRAYMHRSGAPDHIGILVAVKDRLHALKNPYAHLHLHDISFDDGGGLDHAVGPVPLPRDVPVLRRRRRDGPRVGEGGGCGHGGDGSATGVDPRHGHALGADHVRRPGPGQPAGRAGLRRRRVPPGRHHRPAGRLRRGRGLRALQLVRADVAREPRLRAEGEGWKLTEAGATSMIDGGDIPWNCSGGVLSSNPIGASGMLRFLEAALQVRGLAGEHQVDDARRALGHAYGGGSQFFAMWVVSRRQALRRRGPADMLGAANPALDQEVSVKVVVDYDECASNAVCMGILPEVFEVRDDGYLYVLNENPPEEFRTRPPRWPPTAARRAPSP